MHILLALFLATSHAGVLHKFCGYLIVDYPYPYEGTPDVWLVHEIERLEIKERWGRMSADDRLLLVQARAEMVRRSLR